ncbi:hypothetical protein IEO21_02720 [Rhodonia placenta]|uniref:Uncharacterized protein n=1 Tax=Rhodonia placenta TaxID=104341 RepID=A0A8H7P735_9APHY|nr:hypothetical protein IEO21_02720 [Postia placenta]
MAASCQSRTDRSFFSKSKNANFDASTTTTTTTTVTRRVTVVAQAAPDLRIRALKSTVHPPAPQPTPEPSETTGSKKRKSAEPPSQVTKKARKSSPPESSVTDPLLVLLQPTFKPSWLRGALPHTITPGA